MRALLVCSILPAIVLAAGCGSLLGVDDYTAVDCVSNCGDASAADGPGSRDGSNATDGSSANDGSNANDGGPDPSGTDRTPATTDPSACTAPPPCPAGRKRVVARVVGGAGSASLDSEPSGIDVGPGQTASACFLEGREFRLQTTSGLATYSGVTCDDGNTQVKDCDFRVNADVCVTATLN